MLPQSPDLGRDFLLDLTYIPMQYFCYILYSALRDRYYVGSCSNLEERIKKHNTNHTGFTGKTGDWILSYREVFNTVEEARKRESEIKKWKSRRLIEKLICSGHSD